jgi:NADH:ubiquinone oxidoreductase subunit C
VNLDQVLEALRSACPSASLETRTVPVDECFVAVPSTCIRQAVETLLDLGVYHLSTITGQDVDGEVELLYHFWEGQGLTLRTSVSREDARIPTLTDLIPGAGFYEREIGEMLHVTVEGHPDPQPLFLPDDWNGEAPLRREFALPPTEEDA